VEHEEDTHFAPVATQPDIEENIQIIFDAMRVFIRLLVEKRKLKLYFEKLKTATKV